MNQNNMKKLWDFMQNPDITKRDIEKKLNSIPGLEWNVVGKEIGKDLTDQNLLFVHKNNPACILAELTANMGDACLELAYVLGGELESDRKMNQMEAAKKWFGVPENGLQDLTSSQRKEIAKRIGTITFRANGYKTNMKHELVIKEGKVVPTRTKGTYDFRDYGIGQLPDDFTKTLVSIGKSNRQKYHFTTGSYGFGGASSFDREFCDVTFIASKKYGSDRIGFTIVIYRQPDPNTKTGQYFYCSIDGEIPEVKDENFSHGTLKRHYNTNVDEIKTNATQGAGNTWTLMRWLMPSTRFPFMIIDRVVKSYRDGFRPKDKKGKSGVTTWGILNFLMGQKDNKTKIICHNSGTLPRIAGIEGRFGISFFLLPLKKDNKNRLKKDQQKTYVKALKPIIFSDGGQFRASMGKTVFDHRNIAYLQDNLIVIITMENISYDSKVSVFASNREGVNERYQKQIGKEIWSFLGADEDLKEWNIKFQDETFGTEIDDEKDFWDSSLVSFMGGVDNGIDIGPTKPGKPKTSKVTFISMDLVEPPTEFRFFKNGPIEFKPDRPTSITCITNANPDYIDTIDSDKSRINVQVVQLATK